MVARLFSVTNWMYTTRAPAPRAASMQPLERRA